MYHSSILTKKFCYSCCFKDTCSDELLNLGHDDGVAESGLASGGILLHVLKDHLNVGILHDHLDFGISHSVLHTFLIVSCASVLIRLNEHHSLFVALLALNGIAVQLETLLKSFHSFVILLHHLMGSTLSCPGTDEVFIKFDCHVSVLESLNRVHQFEVACGSVRVAGLVLGVTTETFIEFLDSFRVTSILEQGSALILVYNGHFRIKVSFSSLFLLILLATALSILDRARVILNESLAVHFNGFIV